VPLDKSQNRLKQVQTNCEHQVQKDTVFRAVKQKLDPNETDRNSGTYSGVQFIQSAHHFQRVPE
jgi:hypothetical protein